MARRTWIVLLFVATLCIGAAGLASWRNADNDARSDVVAAVGLKPAPTPDHTVATAMLIVAGLCALAAVVLIVSGREETPPPEGEGAEF